ncbi:transglutaminase TgpA family protein [Streptomyces sp. KLOTTS4A1]|uniref:transglutaminase TgpA family protein n=1 Tax=Streptomyces sp. KLOTTS4A1 TaxID=3390996 RepID=UPI0039F5D0A7
MSGRTRLALCAYAATLAAACALLPLIDSAGWLAQGALLLAVQSGVGAGARRIPLARPVTVGAQVLATFLLLTVVFVREQALALFVPTPDSVRELGLLLQTGAEDVGAYATPAPLTDGIRLMLVGGVLVIGLLVDALAVTFRSAAPAGLPLLALYSVAAGLSEDGAGWALFLLAAAGYLLLLLAEGRDRLSQWGRVFGGATRRGQESAAGLDSGGVTAPVRTGRRIGAFALGIALVVPAALPALDGGLLDGRGSGGGSGGGGTISTVDPLVSLKDSLNQPTDREVLSYRTDAESTRDMYMRFVALDEFDGTSWRPAKRAITDVPSSFPDPRGLADDVQVREVTTQITADDDYGQKWLPMPFPATGVDLDGTWRYEPVGRAIVGDRTQTTEGETYTVRSLIVQPTAEQLANAPAPSPEIAREFTVVPRSLPADVYKRALEVTDGAANDYEKAVKLQDYFAVSGGFTYDTEVDSGSGSAAISRFLKDKEGFCVHFSFAMASMARTLDIPARVAVGFTPGSLSSDGAMSVGLRDAHAWPELYFEGVGWTRFEPTPTRGTAPEYTREDTPSDTPSSEAPEATESAAPSDRPSESADPSCPPELRRFNECGQQDAGAGGGGPDDGTPWGTYLGISAGVLVLLVVPLLPLLWRTRVRRVRLASHGRTPAEAAARTLAAWLEVTDSAWDHGIVPDEAQTPRKAAERIIRLGELHTDAAEAVQRLAVAVERVLYAPVPQATAGVAADVRTVRAGLQASVNRMSRLRALFAPRSAVRVAWACSDRWAAFKERWGVRNWGLERLVPRRAK